MSKTLNSVAYDTFSQEKDVVILRDFASNDASIAYKRTAPKRTKDFPGMEKGEVKHTLVDPANGNIIGIVTVSTSIRVGTNDAFKAKIIADTAAIVSDSGFSGLVQDQRLPLNV